MILEVCCGNPESVRAAAKGGARRIELCSALEVDGLTPEIEDIRSIREAFPDVTIHVLIRPRAGVFCYSEEEVSQMEKQVETALEAGADGIVIGCLTPEGDVDEAAMERLLRIVQDWNLARELQESDLCHAANDTHFFPAVRKGASVTFHRAFDQCRKPFEALESIVRLGCDRILTSGQAATAAEGAVLLRELVRRAKGRIGILPGGGVTPGNAARILSETGCTEIHASASEVVEGRKVTSAEKVAAILATIC